MSIVLERTFEAADPLSLEQGEMLSNAIANRKDKDKPEDYTMLQISKLLNDQALKRYVICIKKQKTKRQLCNWRWRSEQKYINVPSFGFLVLLGRTTLEFNLYKSFPQKDIQSLQCQKGITLDK